MIVHPTYLMLSSATLSNLGFFSFHNHYQSFTVIDLTGVAIFDVIDWDVSRPVYKKHIVVKGIQWLHKFCIKKLPTGEKVNRRDHFHDRRCASCCHSVDDDDLFTCIKRKFKDKYTQTNKRNEIHSRYKNYVT